MSPAEGPRLGLDAQAAREVVRRGYDRIGRGYLEWRVVDPATARYLARALDALPAGGRALDLGCGPGRPVTEALAARGTVVGVDISRVQLELCRSAVGSARLVQADMVEVRFRPAEFDVVTAFYSLTHVPRQRLGSLLRRIASWLRPGGAFVGSFGTGDDPGSVDDGWLGEPMFFSGLGVTRSLDLLERAGFVHLQSEVLTQDEDGRPVSFLWVMARTPLDASIRRALARPAE
jgi:SAM-dependent methyltransferase